MWFIPFSLSVSFYLLSFLVSWLGKTVGVAAGGAGLGGSSGQRGSWRAGGGEDEGRRAGGVNVGLGVCDRWRGTEESVVGGGIGREGGSRPVAMGRWDRVAAFGGASRANRSVLFGDDERQMFERICS